MYFAVSIRLFALKFTEKAIINCNMAQNFRLLPVQIISYAFFLENKFLGKNFGIFFTFLDLFYLKNIRTKSHKEWKIQFDLSTFFFGRWVKCFTGKKLFRSSLLRSEITTGKYGFKWIWIKKQFDLSSWNVGVK